MLLQEIVLILIFSYADVYFFVSLLGQAFVLITAPYMVSLFLKVYLFLSKFGSFYNVLYNKVSSIMARDNFIELIPFFFWIFLVIFFSTQELELFIYILISLSFIYLFFFGLYVFFF